MPTICLNMIVKNESKIIERCLNSVAEIIDCYLICDTGSSDDTVAVIERNFAEKGIPGRVVKTEWKNFGVNRTEALKLAKGMADYLLLMDADMKFVDAGFEKNSLNATMYLLPQVNGSLRYFNVRLISTRLHWECVGVTHEYYRSVPEVSGVQLQSGYFVDYTDGGCKADKFERDIVLLAGGLLEEPDNTRYMFYLANSYFDSGQYAKARDWYVNRIAKGGWEEEIYYSLFRKMLCEMRSGALKETWLATGLEAYAYRFTRLEALYEIVAECRRQGDYKLGYVLGRGAAHTEYPKDILFVDNEVHTWKFFDELAICAYWAGDAPLCKQLCRRLLSSGAVISADDRARIEKNLSY